jgi:hypothetical protein
MKVRELRKLLNSYSGRVEEERDDCDVMINVDKPSVGPTAMVTVKSAGFGFDWERGKFIIFSDDLIVPKSEKEDVWDRGFDFIYQLSQDRTPKGNPTGLAKRAQAILDYAKSRRK